MKRIELKIKENLYNDVEGKKPVLIKKNVTSIVKPYIEDIRLIGTVLSNRGKELKNFCKIYVRDIGFLVVNHSYKELDNIQHEYNNGRTEKTIGFSGNYGSKSKGRT